MNPLDKNRRRVGRWLAGLGLVALSAGGIMGAFGVAPSTSTEDVDVRQVVEALALAPAPVEARPEDQHFWKEERVHRGDTFASLMARLGIDDRESLQSLGRSSGARDLLKNLPGRTVAARVDANGALQELIVSGDGARFRGIRHDSGFEISQEPIERQSRYVMRSGRVQSSLFSAMDDAGIPDEVANQFADIFSADIDLHRDIRRGDRFSIVYEMLHSEADRSDQPGRILAAEFLTQGRLRQAVYFEDPATGRGAYFSPTGRNVKRTFLKSPLEFSRVTSGFTEARLHPVLQVWRAHKGIDYSAPIGTRVRSTAEGVIDFVGTQSGYGRVVTIRHSGRLGTLYGHLSGFARDIRPGKVVQQGEIIGFVGMSGLTSGPHLHYEFHVQGVHVDPTRMASDQGAEVEVRSRNAFREIVLARMKQMALLRDVNVASIE